ncbi:lipoprotein [Micromonospora sp. BQ11]|uniref:lipoprotein n=1 Tax=Micromonospora sp. BQ11 TaxID=3452212 RepID=UPI003F8AC2FA
MARRTRAALTAALVCTLLAGCGDGGASGAAATPTPAATGEPWYDEITAAEGAGEAGGAGTPCPLPVTFPVPKSWKPKPIEAPDDEVAAEVFEALARRGGTTATCEVDGRRAGGGFLRVWIVDAPAAEPRAALEAFVAGTEDTVTDRQFREVKANGVDAVEGTWVETSKLLEEDDRNWALALRAGDRTLVLATGEGLLAERTDVLPAYRLAMSGMRPAA